MRWLGPVAVLLCLSHICDSSNAQEVVLDAASVPVTSSPVTLTASSPGADGTISLQLANGTAIGPSGLLTGVSPQRADVAGTTVVRLALSYLPPDFAAANCSCHFLNASQVMGLEKAAAQGGVANFTQSPELLLQYVTALLASPSSTPAAPAQLVNVSSSADNLSSSALAPGVAPLVAPGPLAAAAPSDEQSAPAPAPAPATAAAEAAAAAAAADYGNWSISCPVPAGYDATVPAVLWSVTDVQNGTASAIGIALAGSGKALARAAVWEVSPPVGPTAGGTNITIQGEGFSTGMQCAFVEPGNGTLANVAATVVDSSSIQCITPVWQPTAPSWQGAVDEGGNAQLNLTWPDGCGIVVTYGYYPPPVIDTIYPATLPRYGSFPAWVQLQSGLSAILNTTVAEFEPVVRILGAGAGGGDLTLPANLTTDDSEISFSTPEDGNPLPAGSFVVELSLNGGADFSGGPAGIEQVVVFQGPLVAMETDYISVGSGDSQVNVSMYLIGENASPVTATVSIFQRGTSGSSDKSLPVSLVVDEALYWDVGEYGSTKAVSVNLPAPGEADQLLLQALVVNISSATNADVDAGCAATVVSEATQTDLAVTFTAGVNQVAYPGQSISIPVNVTAGLIPVPAAVDYAVTLLTPVEAPILPMQNGSLAGTLAWDPAHGSAAAITLPVNWTNVPLWAEYRLAVELQPVANAVVTDTGGGVQQVAVHIFGVDQGTCPPGTYLKPCPGDPPTPSPPPPPISQGSPTDTPSPNARLSAIRLMNGAAGTPVTLSTAFQPTVTSYGAVVASNTSDVTLCLQPMQPTAQLSVHDSALALVPEIGQTITATVPLNGSSGASAAARAGGGRRRQRRSLLKQAASQGVSWWRRRRLLELVNASSGGAAAAECSGPEWTLVLSAGQNDFSVFVTSPSATAQGQGTSLSYTQQQAALSAADNLTALYTLSIVQLSNPGHANLSALLSTADANATVVCGPSSDAATLIDSMQAAADALAPAPSAGLQPASAPGSDAMAPSPASVRPPTRSVSTAYSPAPAPGDSPASAPEGSSAAASANLTCAPDQLMYVNVSANTTWISLDAVLAFPTVQGIRVEVNGQVLSQGGDVTADQVTDTTSLQPERQNPGFLPSAIIVGLDPGVPLEVPIVVTAEDGVTSQRYYVVVTRAVAAATTIATALGQSIDELWAAALRPGSGVDLLGDLGPSAPAPYGDFAVAPSSGPGSGPSGELVSGLAPSYEQVMLEDAQVDSPAVVMSPAAQVDSPAVVVSPAAGPSPEGVQPVLMPLPGTSAGLPYSSDVQDASQIPAGWPTPPALQPACGACIAGWASATANSSYCTLCGPGTYAAYMRSPECAPCPTGTYASSWGSSHCRSCVLGTYGPEEGGQLCILCPTNYTNNADGSAACPDPIQPGTNLTEVYAVIVSFGVYFNGTTLDQIAALVGVQASPYQILSNLVRADTATAFNISVGDVEVTGITQVSRRVLFVNISASIPVDVSPDASENDVRAAVNVKSLSADGPINLLSQNPDKFFGRTTKALNVNAQGDNNVQRVTSAPLARGDPALRWPAILGIVLGGLLVLSLCGGIFARKRTRRIYGAVIGALSGSGRGRGAAPLSPMVALSPIRHRAIASPDRILHQTEYSDSAAAALSDAS